MFSQVVVDVLLLSVVDGETPAVGALNEHDPEKVLWRAIR